MHASLLPLIREYPGATWLTIGDGNFASDAYFLSQQGADVVASSLTDASLRVALESGYVARVASINAEDIQYSDNQFDMVVCKEAYHHLPRPAIAFYEMLRVARSVVILIEPLESQGRPLNCLKAWVKRVLRGKQNIENFEKTGNFIYRVSQTEIEKILSALNYGSVAIRRFNDCYLSWASESKRQSWSWGFAITMLGIFTQNLLCKLCLLDYGLATIASFRQPLEAKVRKGLADAGYTVRDLPRNPYL
jgi:ubiquinone/menaquinone biosynthesis C-methylase UbiE